MVKENKITTDECITQGDCVSCGAKEVKGRLENFPVCYDCYSNGKAYKWILSNSLKVIKENNIEIDEKRLNDMTDISHKCRYVLDYCEEFFKAKNKQ